MAFILFDQAIRTSHEAERHIKKKGQQESQEEDNGAAECYL